MSSTSTAINSLEATNIILDRFFNKSIKDASVIGHSYEQLWRQLFRLLHSGGKKLRPRMTFLSYEAFGGRDFDAIASVAAAQELLHVSLLIHDDIIDRDYTRYGVANIAGQYDHLYAPYIHDDANRIHYAHSAALLAGDLLLSGAYHLIATSNLSNDDKTTALSFLSNSIFEVAGGELLDTESSFLPYKKGDALTIARYKTAGYSFLSPLLVGATLAKASDEQGSKLKKIGENLGIAYQFVDDLLGVFGEETLTGKSTTSDIVEGKHTLLVEKAMEHMSKQEYETFVKIFNNRQASVKDIEWVKNMFISSGAKQAIEDEITRYTTIARQELHSLTLRPEYIERFDELITTLFRRRY